MATDREMEALRIAQGAVESLYRLVQIREAGKLTDEEFEKMKRSLIKNL